MNLHKNTTVKTSFALLIAAAAMAGLASLAQARPVRVRVYRPARVVRPAPRPIVVNPAPRPIVVKPAPRPIVVTTPVVRPVVVPVVRITLPLESPAEKALKAEIAAEKDRYISLCKARQNLRDWLAGPGRYRGLDQRVAVEIRLAKVDNECLLAAAHVAELEATLATL